MALRAYTAYMCVCKTEQTITVDSRTNAHLYNLYPNILKIAQFNFGCNTKTNIKQI